MPWQTPSVRTDEAVVTEKLALSKETNNPHPARSFEQSGPLALRPHPAVSNPVLTASDVEPSVSFSVLFIADPFLITVDGRYHLFYEMKKAGGGQAIGHATSVDGFDFTHQSVVVDSASKDSYPLVFKWDGTWYMTPSKGGGDLRIYTADTFPDSWSLSETTLSGSTVADPTVVPYDETWFAFGFDRGASVTRLFYSDTYPSLTGGSWTEHPSSPVFSANEARPGGRPIVRESYIDIPIQTQPNGIFGEQVDLHRIVDLSTSAFTAEKTVHSPVLRRTENADSWNGDAMHHMDAVMPYVGGKDIVAVDGKTTGGWAIGIYTTAETPTHSVRAYINTNTSIPGSGTFTTVQYDDVTHDLRADFDKSNHQFVVPQNGYYDLHAALKLQSPTGSPFRAIIRIQNATTGDTIEMKDVNVNQDINKTLEISTNRVYLSAGDRIQAEAWQNSGSSIDPNRREGASHFEAGRVW